MFTEALLTTARKCKHPTCPSRDEWITNTRHIHTTEYYSALKRNAALMQATVWMKLQNYAPGKKPVTNHILYVSIYLKCPEQANPQRHKPD
jgi:hypothetical protein